MMVLLLMPILMFNVFSAGVEAVDDTYNDSHDDADDDCNFLVLKHGYGVRNRKGYYWTNHKLLYTRTHQGEQTFRFFISLLFYTRV